MMLDGTRVEYLDWLRALAAALVLFGHSNNPIVPGGAVGVSVFFVLSGYLITQILLREGMLAPANIGRFIVRRVARIYPMYVFQIALIIVLVMLFRHEKYTTALDALPGLLMFTRDVPDWIGYGFGVLWTLAVEFWFYVSFPILLYVAFFSRYVLSLMFICIIISLSSKLFGVGGIVVLYYDHFLVGSLCAIMIKQKCLPSIFFKKNFFATGFAIILFISIIPYPGARNLYWFCQSLGAAMGAALIIIAGHIRPPTVSIKALSFLGRISYSVYLMHAVILDIFILVNPQLLAHYLWFFILITLVVSTFTYFFIEQPICRFVNRKLRYKTEGKIYTIS